MPFRTLIYPCSGKLLSLLELAFGRTEKFPEAKVSGLQLPKLTSRDNSVLSRLYSTQNLEVEALSNATSAL